MSSEVGFAELPRQVHKRAQKRGFEFTLMVVGKERKKIQWIIIIIDIEYHIEVCWEKINV